jgi:hypothetical protein
MPTYTETRELVSIEIFPSLNVINTRHKVVTLKDGEKFQEQTEGKSYSTAQFSDFEMEVAPSRACCDGLSGPACRANAPSPQWRTQAHRSSQPLGAHWSLLADNATWSIH